MSGAVRGCGVGGVEQKSRIVGRRARSGGDGGRVRAEIGELAREAIDLSHICVRYSFRREVQDISLSTVLTLLGALRRICEIGIAILPSMLLTA
jgi:hypothetical protein